MVLQGHGESLAHSRHTGNSIGDQNPGCSHVYICTLGEWVCYRIPTGPH